ncbi:MAG: hypothetical protein KY469_08185 [Actinobacteria bacterium]|nr:hypothetical protein [Actinomycetota bacterium]
MPTAERTALWVGLLWFVVAFVALIVVWGSPWRLPHQSPDEAAAAHAMQLVADTGRPLLAVPFDDPGGLSHQRLWVRIDGAYTPAYPAGAFYLYGLPRVVPGGAWLLFLLPAAGLAAYAAGTALVLPRSRWLAALVPLLAFPGTYWVLRPWHNVSAAIALTGLGLLAATWAWRRNRTRWSWATVAAAILASVVRPDQIHVWFGIALLATLAGVTDRRRAARWTLIHLGAAALAFGLVMLGNVAVTGDPLTTPIAFLDFPTNIQPAALGLPTPWAELALIVAPRGWPDWSNVATQFGKYGLAFGPMAGVTVAAIVAAGLGLRRLRRDRRGLLLAIAGGALLLWFAISRVSATDYGAAFPDPGLSHTYPRYTALVFLAVAVLAVTGVALVRHRTARGIAAAAVAILALLGAGYAVTAPPNEEGLAWLRGHLRGADRLAHAVDVEAPADAFVYSLRADKHLWGVRPVGLLQVERPAAPGRIATARVIASLLAAEAAGYRPVVLELIGDEPQVLMELLTPHGLTLRRTFEPPQLEGVNDAPAWEVVRG